MLVGPYKISAVLRSKETILLTIISNGDKRARID